MYKVFRFCIFLTISFFFLWNSSSSILNCSSSFVDIWWIFEFRPNVMLAAYFPNERVDALTTVAWSLCPIRLKLSRKGLHLDCRRHCGMSRSVGDRILLYSIQGCIFQRMWSWIKCPKTESTYNKGVYNYYKEYKYGFLGDLSISYHCGVVLLFWLFAAVVLFSDWTLLVSLLHFIPIFLQGGPLVANSSFAKCFVTFYSTLHNHAYFCYTTFPSIHTNWKNWVLVTFYCIAITVL